MGGRTDKRAGERTIGRAHGWTDERITKKNLDACGIGFLSLELVTAQMLLSFSSIVLACKRSILAYNIFE